MSKDTWNPQQYHKFLNERSQPFFDLMDMVDGKSSLRRIVDLGCGAGDLTEVLHQKMHAQETWGFDTSDAMLEKAKSISVEGLHFKKESIENIRQHGKFDLIFSNAAIQWCDNHSALYKDLKDSLQPQGQLAVQMPMNHDYPTHVLAVRMSEEEKWLKLLNGESYKQHLTMLTPEAYASLLFKLGFKEQKVLQRVYAHVMNSREDVISWVQGSLLTYFQSRLSAQDFADFTKEYRERLFQELPDDKPFFYPFKRILMWARI
ncbi:methyltransferase domain-containing protein [Bdellovibrio bacteriovorus]|uniref:methyltransferase domain-containing protein n=1 Tax=Bdellovibrio bacteriovorus TaxID=959 RepID=UPI0035A59E16